MPLRLLLLSLFPLLQAAQGAPQKAIFNLAEPPPPLSLPAISLRAGLNFDKCTTATGCAPGRDCVEPDTLFLCRDNQPKCICYPTKPKNCDSPTGPACDPGERCAKSATYNFAFCVSEDVINSDPDFTLIPDISPPPSRAPGSTPAPPPPSTAPPTTTSTNPPPKISSSPAPPPVVGSQSAKPSKIPAKSPKPPATTVPPSTSPVPPPPVSSRTPVAPPPPPPASRTPVIPPPPPVASKTPVIPPPPPVASKTPVIPRPSPTLPSPAAPSVSRPPSPSLAAPSGTSAPPTAGVTPTGSANPPALGGAGLAGDPCGQGGAKCRTYRNCLHKETKTPCNNRPGCICMGSRLCKCNDNCTEGEVCSGNAKESYCFSPTLIDRLPNVTSIPCTPGQPTPVPAASPRTGLTGDDCRADANCFGGRRCLAGERENCLVNDILCDGEQQCSITDGICYCFAKMSCACTDNCRDTEICVGTPNGNLCVSRKLLVASRWLKEVKCSNSTSVPIVDVPAPATPNVTVVASPTPTAVGPMTAAPSQTVAVSPGVSEEVTPGGGPLEEVTVTPSPSRNRPVVTLQDDVCVDARALDHLPREELVFETHSWANVLCDRQGSCATHGHIVTFRDVPMMMGTYCELVGCARRVMEVNSPRRRRKLRVKSKTEGLEYTAFAARYQTFAEEFVLSTAVRLGM